MPKTTHTPGPWTLEEKEGGCRHISRARIWRKFARVIIDNPTIPPEEAEANARLIAAAPELLAACEQTEHSLRQGALCEEDLHALRAAIAKAKGE